MIKTTIVANKNDSVNETEQTIPKVTKAKNITNSKGLFTGFRNLTIDKAPIIPRDSAMSSLIIDVTISDIQGNKI